MRPLEEGGQASPFLRHELAMGRQPPGRVRGWVARGASGGEENHPLEELIARFGRHLRGECNAHGFEPHFVTPLRKQSPEAQAAAARWAQRLLAESTY